MVKNKNILNRFYQELIKKENISHKKALHIYESLRKEAVSLGVFTSRNISDGLDIDIKIAKAINSLPR